MERETRFLLLTLLLVVLPSLLLSYFGLETIQAETEALQTRFQQTAERFAGQVADELERDVGTLEAPLRVLLEDAGSP